MRNWYLIHSKIRQERLALENLEQQGFECFLPQINAEHLKSGVLPVVQESLFPRCLFIRLGTDWKSQSWGRIRATVGVNRLVTFGRTPAKIHDNLVSAIRLETENMNGPFADLQAIYQTPDGESRVLLLLNLMNKPANYANSLAVASRSKARCTQSTTSPLG